LWIIDDVCPTNNDLMLQEENIYKLRLDTRSRPGKKKKHKSMNNNVTVRPWWNGCSVGIGVVSSSETSRSPSAPVVESPPSTMPAYVGMFNDHRGVHSSWHSCNDLTTNFYSFMHDKRDLSSSLISSPLWHNNTFSSLLNGGFVGVHFHWLLGEDRLQRQFHRRHRPAQQRNSSAYLAL